MAGSSTPKTANELRAAFTSHFTDRGHTAVASASVIPHDPSLLFTVAGMVPFKSYFTGDEAAPYKRAVTVQKCARAGGKHNDLDDVGRTARHLVFFEMMGNFSFGDYFKLDAIPYAWSFITETLGLDPERLWITVHESDDEAEEIWLDVAKVPRERIQRLGDKDNFWQMGDTGPCGPCSEIYIDKGPAFGPEGGPLNPLAQARYLEFWNLVFMQYNQDADGSRTPLPKPSIDTGAGLERITSLLQGVDAVWETDLMAPIIDKARSITGANYVVNDYEDRDSFSMRVLAEHARSSAMLVSDGVFPSNEGRGYVLRRIIRRAVRHAYSLGTEKIVMPTLAEEAINVMGAAYPDLVKNRDFILNVLNREEESFRQTLKTGLVILNRELGDLPKGAPLSGTTAFTLHDTYGFPLELTQEITAEREVGVDVDGFEVEMAQQRDRAKEARKARAGGTGLVESYREIMEQHGTTDFVGYKDDSAEGVQVLSVIDVDAADDTNAIEIFLDRSPFYAESGGQVGDTGTITTPTGIAKVVNTTFAIPGLRRHIAFIVSGEISAGQTATAVIDSTRRNSIRRNHTGTHILHWALREVLGEHVKQAGSQVDPDRLRFDFNHFAPVSAEEIARIEDLVNTEVLANDPVRAYETTKAEAEAMGAIAFFGDKYGDVVRVLEAGKKSMELCGGTHVKAMGDIGTIKVVSEGSIGSNLRRIEAVTGAASVALLQRSEARIAEASRLVGATPDTLIEGIEKRLDEIKSLRDELKAFRAKAAVGQAGALAATAVSGVVITRVDDMAPGDLRELALAIRATDGVRAVVLGGVTDTGGVSLVAAVRPESGLEAGVLIKDAAKAVGGGGGGKGDIATAGGKNPEGLDEALTIARGAAGI
jgi:alanyl-tRNA synthetase